MGDEQVVSPPVVTPQTDPFTLDETKFASLAPEQRAALDPVLEEWKTRAKSEVEKTSKTWEEKYKPVEEKAKALEKLVEDPRFQNWWTNLASAGKAPEGAQPQDYATPEEYQQAISDAYSGNGKKLKEIQARMFAAMATPVIQELRKSQEELKASQEEFRTTQEMRDLFTRHEDAKDLDAIGRNAEDPNDASESLLEVCLNWADSNGKSMEEGYRKAVAWRDALRVKEQQTALGIVQNKKVSTTSGPSTAKGGVPVVEVADADELMQKNMEAILSGQTPPKFVIRKTEPVTGRDRWGQK